MDKLQAGQIAPGHYNQVISCFESPQPRQAKLNEEQSMMKKKARQQEQEQ